MSSIFSKVGAWFAKVWKSLKQSGAHTAVVITENVITALKSGAPGFIATVVESVFPQTGKLPEEIVAELNRLVPQILAAELALDGMPENPTEADVAAFEQKVLSAFNVTDNKSKLYTTLAAQIYGIIKTHTSGEAFTFAELVRDCEAAYQDYVADVAAQGN